MDSLAYLIYQIPVPVIVAVIVILTVLAIIYEIQCAKMEGLDKIRADVYQLILCAEHTFTGPGEGAEKLLYVVHRARDLLPRWLQVIITDQMLIKIIEEWFKAVKDLLDDGKINNSQSAPKLNGDKTKQE